MQNTDNINGKIKITKRIYYGYSLSALWFYLVLTPLANILNEKQKDTSCQLLKKSLICCIWMTSNYRQICSVKFIKSRTQNFSRGVVMSFSIGQCTTNTIRKRKWYEDTGFRLRTNELWTKMKLIVSWECTSQDDSHTITLV